AVAVTEYFRREAVKRTLLRLDNGDVVFLDQIGGRDGVERLAQAGVQIMGERQHYGQKVIWTKISGSHVLEGDTEFPASVIPLVPVFGRRAYHDRRVLYHGLTYHAHDAQRMKNFWMSAATDRLGRQPAQPIMVTPTMIEGFEEFYRNLNRPSPYLPYNPDPEAPAGRPTREPTPQMPVAELQTALTMEEMVKSTVGIHDAGLGARSNETSGRAIMARQRESDVGTSLYLSNRDSAVGQIGRIVMEMIPRVYDSTRVVPVRRPDSSVQRVRLNAITQDDSGNDIVVNDLSQARLSCVVKSGPGFTTMREEAREALMGIQATDPEAGRLILDQIVRNSDWPGADPIADRFSQAYVPPHMQSAEDRENMPEPQPDPAQQAEAMKAQAEMAKAQADQARAQAEMMKAEAEMAQVQAGAEGAMSPEQVQQMVAAAVAEAVAAMRGEAQ
ncbi:MAG: portal protein, partial [Pseudomonadota bacterium]